MRRVTLARYYLPPEPWRGPRAKPYASAFAMTAEQAAARGALGMVPGSAREIEEPETEDEILASQVHHQAAGRDSVAPPRRG